MNVRYFTPTTRRNVEELSLHLDLDQQEIPLSIPLSLFTCESLTKLEITAGPSINFPKNFFFPKLKSLKLWKIKFGDGCWNEQPFSHCLVLEELCLHNCTWFDMRKFCILTPLLKVLEINNTRDEKGLADCDLEIHAPSLVSLRYWGCVVKDYEMSRFLSLDKAVSIIIYANPPDGFVRNPPTYHNLDNLDLLHGATTDKVVSAFIKAAPNLRRLGFALIHDSSSVGEKVCDEIEDLFRHLQSGYFCCFSGKLRWAELILKKAKSLQSMRIAYRALGSNAGMLKSKEVVMSELLNFTRASDLRFNSTKNDDRGIRFLESCICPECVRICLLSWSSAVSGENRF
ncbi:putative F-box/FBD/LRR-repeat protein At5g62970 [Papaver somniferum]|uniref:putative F-box/FBD/LRR-repeat protein At5g62970 n=1 Tax=Papaver somniferum TaxID=3469 RepID=UPI000E6F7EB6|nr:putative F-box/FBD/LRR-repeat protein At5g62970 [Papaver somniferum]